MKRILVLFSIVVIGIIFLISVSDAQVKPGWPKAVTMGEKNGIMIGANTSYAYTMREMRERVKRLYEAGVKMVMIQGAPFLFQVAMTEFLGGIKEDLKSG